MAQAAAKQYKAVLFDLDGTLLNTLEDLWISVNTVMRRFGEPEHSRDAVRHCVGNGVRTLMRRAVPGGEDNPRFEEELAAQIAYYRGHGKEHTAPYDGIEEMLASLRAKGLSVAILSNKEEVAAKELSDHYFRGRYDLVMGNTKERPRKPDPTIIRAALAEFGTSPAEALYVGDSETDAETAENAGVDYVLVAWGFRERSVLERFSALAIIDQPEELPKLVL